MLRVARKILIFFTFLTLVFLIINSNFTLIQDRLSYKISWEDEELIEYEKSRIGPGEQAEPVTLTDPREIEENEEWNAKEGFYVIVSDKISVDRALPDWRPEA